MKSPRNTTSTLLGWISISAAVLSAQWVVLLGSLVARAKVAVHPFPVFAKFTPFRSHFLAIDAALRVAPFLALLSFIFIGLAWYHERDFQPVRRLVVTLAASVLLSFFVIIADPGGYLSWFLS